MPTHAQPVRTSSARHPARLALLAGVALLPLGACGESARENGAPTTLQAASDEAAAAQGDATRAGGWRLADADSPYLRSHADNAVDWHPWGEAAFALARARQLPVFLSIGYSACHWCHVMEHESFEDEATAAYLREHFVSIKVDREQHPDVDAHYMQAVQRLTGQGGWPLTAFLTADAKVFFGGTYFPAEAAFGRPSFLQVLEHVADIWATQREELLADVDELDAQVTADFLPPADAFDGGALLAEAVAALQADLDAEHGGMRGAQKFPPAMALEFLVRSHARGLDVDLALVETTLDAMASRGLRDHVAGGFHRYCVDPQWLVPHFEKMLYDNALLAPAYAAAARATGHARHADVARDTLAWLMADMRSPEGLYYAARDADSLPFDADGRALPGAHPEEGDVYTWTRDELVAVLGEADAGHVARLFGVTDDGNFERGRSIPRPMDPLAALAADPGEGLPAGAGFHAWWRDVRARLLAARSTRPQAFRDEKCLTSWNGLTLTAFARCARLLADDELAAEAGRLAHAALQHLVDEDGRLAHQRFEGRSSGRANLTGHATLARGLLDAYEVTGDTELLVASVRLTRELLERFEDPEGGLWESTGDDPLLPDRRRELQDGARPAGHSVALELLLRLAPLDDSGRFGDAAQAALARLGPWIGGSPRAFPALLAALDAAVGPLAEVVLDGAPGSAEHATLLAAARRAWLPAALLVCDASEAAEALTPALFDVQPSLLEGRRADAGALAFVCKHGVCQLPASTPDELDAQWAFVTRR